MHREVWTRRDSGWERWYRKVGRKRQRMEKNDGEQEDGSKWARERARSVKKWQERRNKPKPQVPPRLLHLQRSLQGGYIRRQIAKESSQLAKISSVLTSWTSRHCTWSWNPCKALELTRHRPLAVFTNDIVQVANLDFQALEVNIGWGLAPLSHCSTFVI